MALWVASLVSTLLLIAVFNSMVNGFEKINPDVSSRY